MNKLYDWMHIMDVTDRFLFNSLQFEFSNISTNTKISDSILFVNFIKKIIWKNDIVNFQKQEEVIFV